MVDLKRQNRLKAGTEKPKLKVKMQSVAYQMMMSGKDFLKSHVLSWRRKVYAYSDWEDGRAYIFRQGDPVFRTTLIDRLM